MWRWQIYWPGVGSEHLMEAPPAESNTPSLTELLTELDARAQLSFCGGLDKSSGLKSDVVQGRLTSRGDDRSSGRKGRDKALRKGTLHEYLVIMAGAKGQTSRGGVGRVPAVRLADHPPVSPHPRSHSSSEGCWSTRAGGLAAGHSSTPKVPPTACTSPISFLFLVPS